MKKRLAIIIVSLFALYSASAQPPVPKEIVFAGDESAYKVIEANIVTGDMKAYNDFDEPERVKEEVFTAYEECMGGIKVQIPACSVLELRLQK